MKTLIRSFAFWTICGWLCYPEATLAVPMSDQQVSNAVLHAVAIHYPATIATPQRFRTPLGYSRRAVNRVDQIMHGGGMVGYVVSLAPSGYYLVSTDDQLPPWKLRADEGSFTNLPPELIAVLKLEMAEDHQALSELRRVNKSPNPKFRQQWNMLLQTGDATNNSPGPAPGSSGVFLLTTTWDQNDPYNFYSPTVSGSTAGGGRAWAGCTACAMSQILRYHNQPRIITQNHTSTDSLGTHSISDAGMGAYDWANMPNSVNTGSPLAQQKAIGQLMYHAGVALDSNFAASETDANPNNVAAVLQTYFSYTSGGFQYRSPTYTSSQWYNKIAADIDANKPIFYAIWGAGQVRGHALVCDGYQNGNEIHLNLGWSGSWNMWYNMDSVNADNYTWTIHGAVFGITPPVPAITSVSPATLPPSASPQLITVSGSNFDGPSAPNPSTLVFYDPANTPSTKTPINVTPTSMQCNITVQSAGTWKVKVVNGIAESLPYSFTVGSGTAQLTGLSINGPATINENSSGQFTATAYFSDGSSQTVTSSSTWSDNSSVTTISSSGLLGAGSVSANTPVQVTAIYTTGGITKTTSANVTVVNSDVSNGYHLQQLIVNPNFASGGSSWTLTGAFQADSRFSTCLSCPGYAYLANTDGSPGNNLSGVLSQSFTIPSNAVEAALDYWHRTTTTETKGNFIDRLNVRLRLSNNSLVGLDDIWNSNANTAYAKRSIDLLGYKGQTVTLEFAGITDISLPTTFRIDDVTLTITVPEPVTPVSLVISGPSSVTEGGTGQYYATMIYSDGTTANVSALTWGNNTPSVVSFTSGGLLSAALVTQDTSVSIYTTATVNGQNYQAFKDIIIVNQTVTFSSVSISGPSSMNENSSGQFTATAIFSDGSSQSAPSPSWSVISGPGSVSSSGLLTVGEVGGDTTTTVSASVTIGGVTRSTSQQVTIINVPPPPTLVSLGISGQNLVNENSAAQYSATALFSDGSSQAVNPTWSDNSPVTSISLYGLLSAGEVVSDTPVTVLASYTSDGVTQNAQKNVTIVDTTQIGSLQVNLAPAGAVSAGARWQVDGGAWQNSGATVSSLSVGTHTVAFNTISGWTTPANQTATITANQTTPATGTYVVVTSNPPQLSSMNMSNGTFRFVLNGPVGSNYVIQVSSNLVSWSALSTNTIPAGGSTNLIIPSTANKPRQFYRAVLVAGPIAGTVIAWGRNNVGQTNVPPDLTNVVAVAAGFQHNLALKADGTVSSWGENDEGQTNVPAGLNNVTAVAAGWGTSLALKSDGTLRGWGWSGTYGITNTANSLSNITAISACWDCLIALKNDGTVMVWGKTLKGEANIPPGLAGVTAIAGGAAHCLALKGDGTVVAWGDYSAGQTNVPAGLNNVTAIAAGGNHSLARKADGTVIAWGNNSAGQTNVPAGLANVIAISAGGNTGGSHSLALKSDGSVVAWGDNSFGQTNVPINLNNVFSISAGGYHSLVITNR